MLSSTQSIQLSKQLLHFRGSVLWMSYRRALTTGVDAEQGSLNAQKLELPKTIKEEVSLDELEEPQRIPPTHNIPVCNLQLRGYLPQQLDFYADFARRAAYHLGMPCSGIIPLPTQTSRWTVIRSPFVHKKSQENFERKTHKRLLQIKDSHPDTVERWIRYLTMNAPAGIGMRATLTEFGELGVGQRMGKK